MAYYKCGTAVYTVPEITTHVTTKAREQQVKLDGLPEGIFLHASELTQDQSGNEVAHTLDCTPCWLLSA